MRTLGFSLVGLLITAIIFGVLSISYEESFIPSGKVEDMAYIEINHQLVTLNTTRVGSDNPIETAVAVAQIIYPVTEEENSPGAVILININELAEAIVAASRVQHFPVNAPLLYVEKDSIPDLTRQELHRLKPEGVPMDSNVQVYIVGTISDTVKEEVETMGYRTRAFRAESPVELAVMLDDWSSTQHGDHPNDVVIANLDNLEPSIPSAFWNAHAGDGLAFVTNEEVPQATRELLLRRFHGPWLYLFGDESIIPREIARDLAQYGHVTRVAGSNPTEVSQFFAGFHDQGRDWGAWIFEGARGFGWGLAEAGHNAIFISLDGPSGWQNALPATTLSHMGKHAPVLIIEPDNIPEVVRSYLKILKPYPTAPQEQLLNHGWIIGGEDTISWDVQVELDILLEGYLN